MGPLDAFWHLLNFVLPALGAGALAAGGAKLLWRSALRSVPWWRLWLWAASAGAVALIAGLLWFGRDAKMATYALLVGAQALTLWWVGLRPKARSR